MSIRERQILWRAGIKVQRIAPYLEAGQNILDIGTGNGGVAYLLEKELGLPVHPVDVVNKSRLEDIVPQIFDGKSLPFADYSFPTVMLLTVLHHAHHPKLLIKEAARVSTDKVIIMEDIYSNPVQKLLTNFMDSVVNWEWRNHPYNNKPDQEWRDVFDQIGLSVTQANYHRIGVIFSQVTYVLKKKKGRP